jgi:hypothetical protein
MNLKLTTKNISVQDRVIKSSFTREMVDDLNNMYKSMRYKIENQSDRLVFDKYFRVKNVKDKYVNYSIPNKQEIRRFKLLILKNDDVSVIIQKILDNSELIEDSSIQDMEKILINELAQSIDKSIFNNLMNLGKIK